MRRLTKVDNLELCYKNTCVKARDRNAKIITNVLSVALIAIATISLVKVANN